MAKVSRREPVILESDGHQLFGVLHQPTQIAQPAPAILISHGYAGTKVGNRRLYVEMAEELVSHGVATLRLDFRGCGDSEGDFGECTVEDFVTDTLIGLRFLEEHAAVDGNRLGLLGVSLGGAVASVAARRHSGLKGLALWAAVIVGQLWLDDWTERYPDQVIEDRIFCGGVVACQAFREQFLEIRVDRDLEHLSDLPLLHCQGDADQVVFAGHQEAVKQARETSRAPSKFITLPNSNHSFTHTAEREAMIEQTAIWFKETLA